MIPKSGRRFSEKIMLKQRAKAKYRINQNHFALAACSESVGLQRASNHTRRLNRKFQTRPLDFKLRQRRGAMSATNAPAAIWAAAADRSWRTIGTPSPTRRFLDGRRVLHLRMQSRGAACLNLRASRNDRCGEHERCGD